MTINANTLKDIQHVKIEERKEVIPKVEKILEHFDTG